MNYRTLHSRVARLEQKDEERRRFDHEQKQNLYKQTRELLDRRLASAQIEVTEQNRIDFLKHWIAERRKLGKKKLNTRELEGLMKSSFKSFVEKHQNVKE